MYIKIHKGQLGEVVAICDEDIMGKKFEDKEKQIEVSEFFYKGEIKEPKEIIEIMKQATNLNLVGKNTIKLALKEKIINKENIIKIKGVPHAQCLK